MNAGHCRISGVAWPSCIMLQDEVAAIDSGAVGVMEDQASIAEEREIIVGSRNIQIHIVSAELVVLRYDLAMLA
jgi:hypothetical protein